MIEGMLAIDPHAVAASTERRACVEADHADGRDQGRGAEHEARRDAHCQLTCASAARRLRQKGQLWLGAKEQRNGN